MTVTVYVFFIFLTMTSISSSSPVAIASAATAVPPVAKPSHRIEVLDCVRGIAIIHIILYHYFLERYHGSFLIAPEGVVANLSRLTIFQDGGALGFLKNFFGFLFAYGFFSVNLFLLLSGFVLTLSAIRKNETISTLGELGMFYWKKLKRIIIPLYVSILIGVGFLFLRNYLFPSFISAPIYTWIDALKLLFPPFLVFDLPLLQKFNGDLWFITLILQLYILFPLLQYGLRKLGVWKFLLVTLVLTVGYRYFATYGISAAPMGVMYPSQYGYVAFSFFLPRLVEFSFGMALASLYFERNTILEKIMSVPAFLLGIVITFVGFSFDMYRWGWAYADLTVAIGLFLVFINLGAFFSKLNPIKSLMLFLSDSSYENFLIHHYWLNYFLAPLALIAGLQGESWFWIIMIPFVLGSVFFAWGAQKIGSRIG